MTGQTTLEEFALRLIPVGEEIEVVVKKDGKVVDYVPVFRKDKANFVLGTFEGVVEVEGKTPRQALNAVKRTLKQTYGIVKSRRRLHTVDVSLEQRVLDYIGDYDEWVLVFDIYERYDVGVSELIDAIKKLHEQGRIDVAGGITPPPIPASMALIRRI